MSVLDHRLKNPQYANWVANTLALEITNGVLRPYVNLEIIEKHSLIVSKCPTGATCKSCDWKQAKTCTKNICNIVIQEIEDSHRFSNPSFKITNPSKWLDDSWEIAKCFMPPIQRNEDCTSADADFSAVVNIIINDKHFDALVSCDLSNWSIFHMAREMRNSLMHSSVYKVSDSDFKSNIDILINLLNGFITQLPKTREAIEQLNKLKTEKLQITQQNLIDAHEQGVRALHEEVDRGKNDIKKYVEAEIAEVQKESFGKVRQSRLESNFVKGCTHSLIKSVKSHIANLKPHNVAQDEWTLSKFLDKIEYIPDIAMLPDRHKRMLYPDLGKPPDVIKWDLFLLCHILSVDKNTDPLPNDLASYLTVKNHKRQYSG